MLVSLPVSSSTPLDGVYGVAYSCRPNVVPTVIVYVYVSVERLTDVDVSIIDKTATFPSFTDLPVSLPLYGLVDCCHDSMT
jgi:hypothetical protein